ncbi:Hpt domain-containing protein [Bacteriovorax sp. Seq25_V]|uniref:Hpt domain-containing protein n=1 Tax=Bacteriovorax sp. Seq25_V TaxID=1201288 RepID=UPI00038A2698|nr:Hpt domain-containing protein [Bacteriovorax sp. Seq25_V]EQC45311.1 Hpt domain protein [Bacteriovorax sp. Seq25_V]
MEFDSKELTMMFGDDQEIFFEIFGDFEQSLDEMLGEISSAIEAKNAEALQISAHTFKGVLSTFCALESKELAFELEQMGRAGSFDGAVEKFEKLKEYSVKLIASLKSFQFSQAA